MQSRLIELCVVLLIALSAVAPARSAGAAAAPDYWFAPPIQHGAGNDIAAAQIAGLLDHPEAWEHTLGAIRVFKLYIYETSQFTDELLGRLFRFLSARNIQLALEMPPLTLVDEKHCGWAMEGYARPAQIEEWMRRIQHNGGELAYVAMDEPLFYGSLFKGDKAHPNTCRASIQDVAKDAARNLQIVRKHFPKVLVGDVEPFYVGSEGESELQVAFRQWFAAFQESTGQPLAFMHYDIGISPDIPEALVRNEVALEGLHVRQGIILNGAQGVQSDEEWLYSARAREGFLRDAERPGYDIVLQDWKPFPVNLAPESQPTTFTGFCRYVMAGSTKNPAPKALFLRASRADVTNRSIRFEDGNAFPGGSALIDVFYAFAMQDDAPGLRALYRIEYPDGQGTVRSVYTVYDREADSIATDHKGARKALLGFVFGPDFNGGRPFFQAHNLQSGARLYTASAREYEALPAAAWRKDGVAFRFPRL